MRGASVSFAVWSLAALSFVNTVSGQEQRGRVVRTEIYNGGTRTVRYNGAGISPGEAQSLRELERLENETSYLRSLEDLKKEYVASERILEPYRRSVQQMEYGVDRSMGYGAFAGGYGYAPAVYAGWGGFPSYAVGTYGWGGYAPYGFGAYGMGSESRSLATGMGGNEGVMKANIARTIAAQATAEYASAVDRAAERAVVRASASPTLRVALGMPAERAPKAGGDIRTVATDSPVTLTLTSGEVVRGQKYEEKGNWFIVTLSGGKTLRLRENEVARIETSPTGVKPASD
jgi:hypothetical protein